MKKILLFCLSFLGAYAENYCSQLSEKIDFSKDQDKVYREINKKFNFNQTEDAIKRNFEEVGILPEEIEDFLVALSKNKKDYKDFKAFLEGNNKNSKIIYPSEERDQKKYLFQLFNWFVDDQITISDYINDFIAEEIDNQIRDLESVLNFSNTEEIINLLKRKNYLLNFQKYIYKETNLILFDIREQKYFNNHFRTLSTEDKKEYISLIKKISKQIQLNNKYLRENLEKIKEQQSILENINKEQKELSQDNKMNEEKLNNESIESNEGAELLKPYEWIKNKKKQYLEKAIKEDSSTKTDAEFPDLEESKESV